MSGYESSRPDEADLDGIGGDAGLNTPEYDGADFDPDERPVDEAAARAHDVQPDDEKPVLPPDEEAPE